MNTTAFVIHSDTGRIVHECESYTSAVIASGSISAVTREEHRAVDAVEYLESLVSEKVVA